MEYPESGIENLTDEQLVERIVQNRNAMLFEHLYDRYAKRVYNKCRSFSSTDEEAEDLAQDVFLHLFLKLPLFRGDSKFSTWLYSLIYNFCVNYVNRDKKRKINSHNRLREETVTEEGMLAVDEEEFQKMQADKLRKALQEIDPEDRALLLLKYQDEVPIKELQQLLDIGESAVKMRLKRAKAKVLEIYRELP